MTTNSKDRRERRMGRTAATAGRREALQNTAGDADQAAVRRGLSKRARLFISLAILFHLFAVFVAALRVPPVSQLATSAAWGVHPYTDVVLVNPGYRFFAPDPGESHMIRAEIVAADGSRHEETYPDLQHDWPRLLYHRHFMLTSRLADAPVDPLSRMLADSYARHLFARDSAREVRVLRRMHVLPTRDQVLGGMPLSDERLYVSPYNSPTGIWLTEGSGPREATKLELRIEPDMTASIAGRLRGMPVRASWKWEPGPGNGPRRLAFFEGTASEPACTADSPAEHELVLHYPLPSGVSRLGSVEHVSLRRDPPPLAIYRGEQP